MLNSTNNLNRFRFLNTASCSAAPCGGWSSERIHALKDISLRNVGILTGVGLATAGACYYMQSDAVEVDDDKTREVRKRLKYTYGYVLGGLAITSVSSYAFYQAGLPEMILDTSPWVFCGLSLATTVPLIIGTNVVDFEKNFNLKNILWAGLNVSLAAGISTLGLLGGPVVAQAALATGCVVGGLSLVASKAKPGSLKKFEGALGVGLGGLVAASLGNMIFPMPILHNVMLYGGLAAFSGLLLTDTQKLIEKAETSGSFDPVNESLGIYLDVLNIFERIAIILFELQREDKKREDRKKK